MLCYKTQGNSVVCNKLPSGTVGWVVACGTVGFGSFVVQIRKVLFFSPFPKFLFLGLGLVLGSVLGLGDFKLSSLMVRELGMKPCLKLKCFCLS